MKVTFLDTPQWGTNRTFERVFGCTYSVYPVPNIFALTLLAHLEEKGHRIAYVDAANDGWGEAEFERFLDRDDSDLYMLHTINLSREADLRTHDLIRRRKKEVPVVFMGPAPTLFVRDFLIDEKTCVVRGEPEETMVELLERLSSGTDGLRRVSGLSFLEGGEVVENRARPYLKDLDSLPFPKRSLVNRDYFFNPKFEERPFTTMLTSRGCPYRCHYCVPCSLSFARELEYKKGHDRKPPIRGRSAVNVIEEFRHLKEEGYRSVTIIDDDFTWNSKRVIDICEGIRDLGFKWDCLSRADHLTEPVVRALAGANCKFIHIGVESFNQEILDSIQKDLKVERIYEAINLLNEYRIAPKLNLLIGASPLETDQSVKENLRIIRGLDVDAVMFSVCTPFPGTEFYRQAVEEKWFEGGEYRVRDVQGTSIINLPHLSAKRMSLWLRYANWTFFLRPKIVLKQLRRIRSFGGFMNSVAALRRKLLFWAK